LGSQVHDATEILDHWLVPKQLLTARGDFPATGVILNMLQAGFDELFVGDGGDHVLERIVRGFLRITK
jgi:hypothetical protein